MNLKKILEGQAEFVDNSGVRVVVNSARETVSIEANNGDALYLQGHEAEKFINDCLELYEQTQTLTIDVIEKAIAYKYLDCLWS